MKDIGRPNLAILKDLGPNPDVLDKLGAGRKEEVERQKRMIELLESIDKTLKEVKDKLDKNP